MISQNHVIEGPFKFMTTSSLGYVIFLPNLVAIGIVGVDISDCNWIRTHNHLDQFGQTVECSFMK